MRDYTTKEKAKITAGAVASLGHCGMACRAGPGISFRAITASGCAATPGAIRFLPDTDAWMDGCGVPANQFCLLLR
jgi:hypothetical protein